MSKEVAHFKLTAIELGTGSIKVLMAEVTGNEQELCPLSIKISGLGTAIVNKERQGAVVFLEKNIWKGEVRRFDVVKELLNEAIADAEAEAGWLVKDSFVYFSIAGARVSFQKQNYLMHLGGKAITQDKIEKISRMSNDMAEEAIHHSNMILGNITRFYRINGSQNCLSVRDLVADSLEIFTQSIYLPQSYCDSLQKLISDVAGVNKAMPLYLPLAIAYATLGQQWVNRHCFSIDIGAGTTSFALQGGDGFPALGQIPIGGIQLINDLMQAFNINYSSAQRILYKLSKSETDASLIHPDDGRQRLWDLTAPNGKIRKIPVSSIEKVLAARIQEIFQLIRRQLETEECWQFVEKRVVLSGGVSHLKGILELAQEELGLPICLFPLHEDGYLVDSNSILKGDISYASLIGMLYLGNQDHNVSLGQNSSQSILERISHWIWKKISFSQ